MNQSESKTEPIGLPSTICRRCGRHLSAKLSVKHGYGPICYQKNKAGDLMRAKQIEHLEPRTVTDKVWAGRVTQAIYRIIDGGPGIEECAPADLAHGKWLTGEDIKTLPLESFDHDGGLVLPGFGKPQWFYLHTDRYDLAIWKIRITDEMILRELEREYPGQVPPAQQELPMVEEKHHSQRPTITEEPCDRPGSAGRFRAGITEEPMAGS